MPQSEQCILTFGFMTEARAERPSSVQDTTFHELKNGLGTRKSPTQPISVWSAAVGGMDFPIGHKGPGVNFAG